MKTLDQQIHILQVQEEPLKFPKLYKPIIVTEGGVFPGGSSIITSSNGSCSGNNDVNSHSSDHRGRNNSSI